LVDHEITGVEEADALEHGAIDQHAATGNVVDRIGQRATRPDAGPAMGCDLAKHEPPLATPHAIWRVTLENQRTGNSGLGIGRERQAQERERVGRERRVVVEL